ncbi:MAG: HD domain-containing protein [Ruminococcus sp.]|nr:HD domain-containing protein [Ruminococcus sp.]
MNPVLLYYDITFAVSVFLMMVYALRWHKHFDVHFTLVFILIPLTNLGYTLLYRAESIGEAITANKLVYVGGCYQPMLLSLIVLSMCHIRVKRWMLALMMSLTTSVYLSVALNERSPMFYQSVKAKYVNGILVMDKTYGIMHNVFYAMVVLYFYISIVAMVYSYFAKKDVSRKILYLLFAPDIVAVMIFFLKKRISETIELVPLVFVMTQIIYLIIIHRICLYDVTDTAIDSLVQKGSTGLISFDLKYNYLGSNETAKRIFPELKELTVDKPISADHKLSETALVWLKEFIDDQKYDSHHYDLDGRTYLINVSFLYDGNHKRGFQFTITDDTLVVENMKYQEELNSELDAKVKEKTAHIVEMHNNLIMSMAMMVESRDKSTGGHIMRTSEGVRLLIEEIQKDEEVELPEEFCRCIIKAAPMHDLGKIAVDDAILRKPGRFTDEEYAIMKTHAAEGARIVHKILENTDDEYFKEIAENVAHYHHERWDGSGYPEGLSGDDIPLEARIMAIADVYDALVSKRVYKEKMSFEEADKIIMEGMGKYFDKALEKYYVSARPKLEEYYRSLD